MSTAPKVWLNGRLVSAAEATLSFLTPGLHYGIAVFEGLRAYETAQGPAIFRLGDHMRRLIDSALVLGFRTLPHQPTNWRTRPKTPSARAASARVTSVP